MAPRAHDLVLRDLPARADAHRLRRLRSRVPVPLQLVLRSRRPASSAAATRPALAPDRRRGRALPRARRRRDGEADRPLRRRRVARRRRARRARPAPRAAAPRAAAHGHQARAVVQPARLRRTSKPPPPRRAARRAAAHARLSTAASSRSATRPHRRSRSTTSRPRHKVYLEPFRHRRPARDRGRVARVHRRRRLRAGPSCGSPTAGTRCRSTVGTRRCTGATTATTAGRSSRSAAGARSIPNEPVVHVSHYEADAFARWSRRAAARPSSSGSTRSRRSRRSRDAGLADTAPQRRPAASRAAPARRRACAQAFGDVWQWTASAYLPYPRFAPAAGRGRRVQRQVHERPDGAARRRVRHARRPRPRRPTATSSRPRAAGCSAACASRPTRNPTPRTRHDQPHDIDAARRRAPHRRRPARRAALRRRPRPALDTRRTSRRSGSTTTAARSSSTTSRGCPSTTRPAASGRSSRRARPRSPRSRSADTLVELGSGTSDKTRILLDALRDAGTITRFVPFDVSEQTLRDAAAAVEPRLPERRRARGRRRLRAPPRLDPGRRPPARRVPRRHDRQPRCPTPRASSCARSPTGSDPTTTCCSALDLVKDIDRLEAAYDDAQGVTAEFNKNVLAVMNRELDADFDDDAASSTSRCSTRTTRGSRCGCASTSTRTPCTCARSTLDVPFAAGEEMRTEVSAKFTREQVVDELARRRACSSSRWWTDPDGDFALLARPRRAAVGCI